MKKRVAFSVLSTFILLTLSLMFQNCSEVKLTKTFANEIQYASGKINLCLDEAHSKYTIDTAMALNLNIINSGRTIAEDTDADGLSDQDELRYGFDRFKRRSKGPILDKICLDVSSSRNCENVAAGCSRTPNALGLSDCDLQTLGLQNVPHPSQGVDTDKDGIADFVEIKSGTVPNQFDRLGDPDHDLVLNIDEVSTGSNFKYYDQPFDQRYAVQTTLTKKAAGSTTCTGGEEWEMKIIQLPWSKMPAVTDELDSRLPAGGLSLTRPNNTNTGLVVIKLRTRAGETGNSKVLIRPLLLSDQTSNLEGTIQDFIEAGEVLP